MENEDAASGGSSSASQAQTPQPIDARLQKLLDKALYGGGSPIAQAIRDFLNGTWLGEPLHVILTDVPIGAWTVAMIFDALDLADHQRAYAKAADTSIAIGLVGAAAAATTGWADWSDVDPPARRVGMFHGLLNASAAVLYATSLIFRKKRRRIQGRIYAALGYSVLLAAARLGGDMVYKYRVGVDRTSGQEFPGDFVAVMPEAELQNDKPARAEHNGVPILLVRQGDHVFALAETCSHFGAPLSEGKLVGDSIVCPWHDSRFGLEDGHVIHGPAVHPQPCLEARTRNGNIEVRKPRDEAPDAGLKFFMPTVAK